MRILICSNGTQWARKSARFALQLFRETTHQLTILIFKERASDLDASRESITRATRKKEGQTGATRSAETIEQEIRDLVDELDIDTEIEWLSGEGDLSKHVLDIAEDYDLVCVGGGGRGGFSQNMLGLVADDLVRKGKGNLMVTKTTDRICRNVLVALHPQSVNRELAHYLGQLFEETPASITVDVLWKDSPGRFDGYFDAAVGQRVKDMMDADLFEDPEQLRELIEIIDSYGVTGKSSYQDFHSLDELVDNVDPAAYDLILVRPPDDHAGLIEMMEPVTKSLDLMRKSSTNVMLLRTLSTIDP